MNMTAEEKAYSKQLFDAVLDTVITLNPDPSGAGGIVDPDVVRTVLTQVAATIDLQAGLGRVPSERRKTGEAIGRLYAAFLKGMIDSPVDTEWPKGLPVNPDGSKH